MAKNTKKKKKDTPEVQTEIKGTGKFGLGHKKTKKAAILYIFEDIWEAIIKAKNWCVKNYRTSIPAAICLVLVIIVIVTLVRNARITKQQEQAATTSNTVSEEKGVVAPEESLQENAYDYINQFIGKYYAACVDGDVETYMSMRSYTDEVEQIRMQKKANYIEYYQNLTCYTKPGPIENSYIVYVYYEVKFYDIETVAPGLNTLYVCTNDAGELYVFSGEVDESVSEYMQAISVQEDVKDLFNKVQVTYNDAVATDDNLRAFLEELAVNLKEDVAVGMAQIDAANNIGDVADASGDQPDDAVTPDEDAANSGEVTQDNTPEPTPTPEVQIPVSETVRTTDTVNIRSSSSTEATKIATVSKGTRLIRMEELANGWSRVSYDGQEGYIKSEYLEVVETSIGTVTTIENVNIRAEASETATKLGMAYTGTVLELIETQDDGWSRIIFNGQTAYVKSEYVQ